MDLVKLLEKTVSKYKTKPALKMQMGFRNVEMNYEEVYQFSKKVACFLTSQGVKKGDRVLLLAPNSPYWVCVYWGCVLMGAILVPLNIQSTAQGLEKIAKQTNAKIIFKYLFFKSDIPKKLKVFDIEFLKEYVKDIDCKGFTKVSSKADDLCQIMYTSGTTGDPKGVMLSHRNLSSNVINLAKIMPKEEFKFLSILPLSHILEQTAGFLFPFTNGWEIVYAHSPTAIAGLLKENKITTMAAVPEFLDVIMKRIEKKMGGLLRFSKKIPIQKVRRLLFYPVLRKFGGKLSIVASGGAPLDVKLEEKWNAMGVDLLQGYGLTETSPIVSSNSLDDHRVGSVGKVLPGVKVKISKDGEILVKGPNVFQGYYKNRKKTGEVFTKDGWFKTGDGGELDKDGYLFLKGRKKYMILGPSGQNVYPEDIEFELNRLDGVKDSCVVGLDKANGQVEIHAAVLLEKKIDLEKVILQANRNLASFQKINAGSIWPFQDFPRSATRKIKKPQVINFLEEKGRKNVRVSGELKDPLVQILAEVSNHKMSEINKSTKIVRDLGLDSLLRMELVARIEEKFRVQIDESKINEKTTVTKLQQIIKVHKPIKNHFKFKKWPVYNFVCGLRRILQYPLFGFLRLFIKYEVEGLENLEGVKGPVIFMPNHLSYIDPVVLARSIPKRFRWKLSFAAAEDMVYGEYKKVSLLIELFMNSFPFPRKKNSNISNGLKYMGRMLDNGSSVVVFPEGKISKSTKLLPLKEGAGLVATSMDVCVIPIKVEGVEKIAPPYVILPRRRGVVKVKFGGAMRFSPLDSYIKVTKEIERVMKAM